MDKSSAQRLTDLFQNKAQGRRINRDNICISTCFQNEAEMNVRLRSPFQAAQYLKFLQTSQNPLFQRGSVRCGETELPDPIVFKAWGLFRDQLNNRDFAVLSVRMRFFEAQAPSELCFDEDFCRTDWDSPANRVPGPSLTRFIHTLERAGVSWGNMSFSDESPTLQKLRAERPFLRLVK